ncbi:hypothetical protein F5Y12DRAFT_330236 [Xylaria sp. FL1777]|nr:hypothetical protein F5Y12DRAFT_330236 [Xylaria sp. FL1777]
MSSPTSHFFDNFATFAFNLLLEMLPTLYILVLYIAAPLLVETATSNGTEQAIFNARKRFTYYMIILAIVMFVRSLNEFLGLISLLSGLFRLVLGW